MSTTSPIFVKQSECFDTDEDRENSFPDIKKHTNSFEEQRLPLKYSAKRSVFETTGFTITTKIGTTLQGSVYNAINRNGDKAVIKRASLSLCKLNQAKVNNKRIYCQEDINKESLILKLLTQKNPPKGMIKYYNSFYDNNNYFLIMENGGESFFDYMVKMHKKIENNEIKIKVWKKHVKILFKQILIYLDWLHNNFNYAHLDLSLENMTIKGVKIENGKFISHGIVSIIDFGLSEYIGADKGIFRNCAKFCGKTAYKSPECYSNIPYNAYLNDVWSLGVCFFMMSFGSKPFNVPCLKCPYFQNIWNGYTKIMCIDIGKKDYLSKNILDLLNSMFTPEKQRITIKQMLSHKYFK